MGRSSLLGTDKAAAEPARRGDTEVLGPGDSSDSGSDLMGVADDDGFDPGMPVDVAMGDDHVQPMLQHEAEAADISVDREGNFWDQGFPTTARASRRCLQ